MSYWRPERQDLRAMVLIALVPILLAIPRLTPWLKADPLYYTAGITVDAAPVTQFGMPYLDPNNGFQTQALGYRAAKDWLSAEVPWWNPYAGIGMPLAAEYQPSAFFPLTLLLMLPRGMVLLQISLQILAGLGTFALLRQLGLGRLSSTTAGIVYAMNGTFAWFAHGPAAPVPFLPWFIYGIERAYSASRCREPGGWRTIGVSMAMSLLAGFPETAYINGLLALVWATVRGAQLASNEERLRLAWRVVAGGIVGLAIASPQIVSFVQYLSSAHVARHDAAFATARLHELAGITSLVAPYAFGPLTGYGYSWDALPHLWGGQGGYVTVVLLATAFYGLLVRRDAIAVMLATWIATTLCKSFGIEPFLTLWNLVPAITSSAFARYVQPTWELAAVVLAAIAIDSIANVGANRALVGLAVLLATGCIAGSAVGVWQYRNEITVTDGLLPWTVASFSWAIASVTAVLALLYRATPRSLRFAAAVLAIDATVMCAVPILANPREGRLDTEAVAFLRANLGLQRFYTLGPIQPNYGAYFGIASINHNYLPVPEAWVRHVHGNLDRQWTDFSVFNGDASRNSAAEFRANVQAFQELGVKYVVTDLHSPGAEGLTRVRRVYEDSLLKIFELPDPQPYFEALDSRCRVQPIERRMVRVECPQPTTLVRRELFFPGWTATVNQTTAVIHSRSEIFQAVTVPQGNSEVRFHYAPPRIGWTWLVMGLALAALVAPSLLLRRKHQ